jgi:hypothetical protein
MRPSSVASEVISTVRSSLVVGSSGTIPISGAVGTALQPAAAPAAAIR